MSDGSSKRYPPELRERAVRMVAEISDQEKSEWTAITEVAGLLGVGTAETVRRWVRHCGLLAHRRSPPRRHGQRHRRQQPDQLGLNAPGQGRGSSNRRGR